jgi:hypothetical protein
LPSSIGMIDQGEATTGQGEDTASMIDTRILETPLKDEEAAITVVVKNEDIQENDVVRAVNKVATLEDF